MKERKQEGFTKFKIKDKKTKNLLRKSMAGILPTEIKGRVQHPFVVPLQHWIKKDLRTFVVDLIADQQTRKTGIFKFPKVDKILDLHLVGHREKHEQVFLRIHVCRHPRAWQSTDP